MTALVRDLEGEILVHLLARLHAVGQVAAVLDLATPALVQGELGVDEIPVRLEQPVQAVRGTGLLVGGEGDDDVAVRHKLLGLEAEDQGSVSDEQKDGTLRQIAFTSASSDNPNTALKVFEKIKDDSMRVLSKLDVARAWTRNDRLELADHLLGNVPAEVAKVEWPRQRTKCLAELAQVYELREQAGGCSENLFEALKTAATIKGSYPQARALIGLAVIHKELDRPTTEAERKVLEEIIYRLD